MRLMSFIRSAALAIACLVPIASTAEAQALPSGLFDFSITFTSNDTVSNMAVKLGFNEASEDLRLSGVMTLDGSGNVTAFQNGQLTFGDDTLAVTSTGSTLGYSAAATPATSLTVGDVNFTSGSIEFTPIGDASSIQLGVVNNFLRLSVERFVDGNPETRVRTHKSA